MRVKLWGKVGLKAGVWGRWGDVCVQSQYDNGDIILRASTYGVITLNIA
jgi:hypothetical protein